MFDFTSMYAADNACRAKRIFKINYNTGDGIDCDTKPCKKLKSDNNCSIVKNEDEEGLLLMSLVGDSLLEPFWPTGSGCGRGFLSSMDTAWMVRQWAVKKCKTIKDEDKILSVLSERESIYHLLAQTKSSNLSQNYASYTICPVTRYPNLNSTSLLPHQCRHLLYDRLPPAAEARLAKLTLAEKRARRITIATTSPFSDEILQTSKNAEKENISSLTSQAYEESLAAFEESYRLLNSLDDNTPSLLERNNFQHYHDLSISPSASNLATIGKSRARDIESAFRHRRQKERNLIKREYDDDELESAKMDQDRQISTRSAHKMAQNQYTNHFNQQLKSKAAWFLDQKSDNSSQSDTSYTPNSKNRLAFSDRVKDMEYKLKSASGLSDDGSNREEIRIPSTRTGIYVMSTASTLQQLLNPRYQEEKLRKESKNIANRDIKCIGKLSKQDWNIKCFEYSNEPKGKPIYRPAQSSQIVYNYEPSEPFCFVSFLCSFVCFFSFWLIFCYHSFNFDVILE